MGTKHIASSGIPMFETHSIGTPAEQEQAEAPATGTSQASLFGSQQEWGQEAMARLDRHRKEMWQG